jgi:GH15 family glucan-1,4-alpha-glucosidase
MGHSLPFSDYGVIGNLLTTALVGRDGSIDWCCFPELDSPSVFGALLDQKRGGRFRIHPPGASSSQQAYVQGTNVLKTVFTGENHQLTVTDFMPLRGDIRGKNDAEGPPAIIRKLECEGQPVEVELEWSPRFDYSRVVTRIEKTRHGFDAKAGSLIRRKFQMSLKGPLDSCHVVASEHGPSLMGRVTVTPDQPLFFVMHWGRERSRLLDDPRLALEATVKTWRNWLAISHDHDRSWAGHHRKILERSELAIKLLIHKKTGAIAAAATTSLPEHIGGSRNWDYRHAWVRDASMTAQALTAIGHVTEAHDYLEWMQELAGKAEKEQEFHLLYGLRGETKITETELSHWDGYRGSSPVRIGNEAFEQDQYDLFGELLDIAYEIARTGHPLKLSNQFLARLADEACQLWREPDHGIWEMRRHKKHYLHSKLMIWVALDRALLLARFHGLEGDTKRWRETKDLVRNLIIENGYSDKRQAYTQTLFSDELDASALHLGLQELLPLSDERMQKTIDAIKRELGRNGLVMRYVADDGLPGEEGAFLLCTFWLVDALALSGRVAEAVEIFDRVVERINSLGLMSEEMDTQTFEYLGNYPQAFSHIGLINSLLTIAYAQGKKTPIEAPIGSPEHRRKIDRDEHESVEA